MLLFKKTNIRHSYGLLFNIFIIAAGWTYFALLRTYLVDTAIAIHHQTATAYWAGIVVGAAMLVENIGIFYKISQLEHISSRRFGAYVLIFAHAVMEAYLLVFVLRAFGVPVSYTIDYVWILALPLVKQIIMFFYFTATAGRIKSENKKDPKNAIPVWIVNIFLALAGVVFIIVLWESLFIAIENPIKKLGREATIIHFFATVITMMFMSFLILLPLRLGFLIDDFAMEKKKGCFSLGISLVFTAIFSVLPMVFMFR